MCDIEGTEERKRNGAEAKGPETSGLRNFRAAGCIPVDKAVGAVLAHDITEIRPGEFKGCAFRKGHIIRQEDVCHLQRLGKEHLFVLDLGDDEMHEDDAAYALATALMGEGVSIKGEPKEGKINIIASRDGLLKIHKDALLAFNMLGDVMCATLHGNTVVRKGQTVAGTRAIPLVVKKAVVEEAVRIAEATRVTPSLTLPPQGGGNLFSSPLPWGERDRVRGGIIQVREIRKPRAGVVITGNEVYNGRIKDAFAPVISEKIKAFGGEVVGIYYAPDDEAFIEARLRELVDAGADLLVTTGGMSVDPDDVTRFAIRNLGATDITYGSAVLPGAMFLVAYMKTGERASGLGISKEIASARDSQPPSTQHQISNIGLSEKPIPNPQSLIPILGIPACGMYANTTIFDLVLPRVLAGEKIGRRELAELGHGGLCLKCETCRYPVCPFGK